MEMKLHGHEIRVAWASVFGMLLLATPLAADSSLANGIVTGMAEPKKFREAARIVLTKEPKVESTTIREMREEIERISKKKYYETSVN